MNNPSSTTPILAVLDNDEPFLDSFKSLNSSHFRVELAANSKDAQALLADQSKPILATCVSEQLCSPCGLPIIRFAKSMRPAMPVYYLETSEKSLLGDEELQHLHIERCLKKPINAQQLVDQIFPVSASFNFTLANEIASQENSKIDSALTLKEGGMYPIATRSFLCGSKSFFDVYVRMKEDKFVKILKANEEFDRDRIMQYMKKGVQFFYIRKEAQQLYLQYSESLTAKLLSSKTVSAEVKSAHVLGLGKQTMDFLKSTGINDDTLQNAKRLASYTNQLVDDLRPKNSPELSKFLQNAAMCEHGTGVVLLVSLMVPHLGYNDPKLIDVICLSAYLHDIGLINAPEAWLKEDILSMTAEEQQNFEQHPLQGAIMLKKIRTLNPLVCQVVSQHHERRTRKGFPLKLGSGAITPVSELIGIADTFQQILLWSQAKKYDPFVEMESHQFDLFSFQIIEAFRKSFMKS